MATFVVFVALPEEAEQVHSYLMGQGFKCAIEDYSRHHPEYYFSRPARHEATVEIVLHVMSEMGNRRIASRVQPVIARYKPLAALMAGIAGTLDPSAVRLGDVVVASGAKAMYADALKRRDPERETFATFEDGKPKEPSPVVNGKAQIQIDDRKRVLSDSFFRFRREYELVERGMTPLSRYVASVDLTALPIPLKPVVLRDKAGVEKYRNDNPSIKLGTMLGSDFVVDSDEFIAFLKERNPVGADQDLGEWDYYRQRNKPEDRDRHKWVPHPLLAVDMETLGFFSAINRWEEDAILAFAVRGISDQASNKELTDLGEGDTRKIAALNASAVVLDIINYLLKTRVVVPRS